MDFSPANQQQFLAEIAQFSHFHKRLEEEEKRLFEKNTWKIFTSKTFEPKGIPSVSFRMRTIISSYLAQLTFGYDEVILIHFKHFEIYPSPYISPKSGALVRGEASSKGIVRLSWLDLVEGHNNAKNGVNLALHEFAHALQMENFIKPGEYQFIHPQVYLSFVQLAEEEMVRMKNSKMHFLRSYGARNTSEFFAVAIENFFERPVAMELELPEIFHSLTQILKLNPCKRLVRLENE